MKRWHHHPIEMYEDPQGGFVEAEDAVRWERAFREKTARYSRVVRIAEEKKQELANCRRIIEKLVGAILHLQETVTDQGRRMAYLEWMLGDDAGASAMTILRRFDASLYGLCRYEFESHPRDRGDMFRCLRMLRRFPEVAEAFATMDFECEGWATWQPRILEELKHEA